MSVDPMVNAQLTFADLPPGKALSFAKELSKQSVPSYSEKLTYAGYKDVACHYIICENDKVISPKFQRRMIELLKSSVDRPVEVHTLNSGHVPMITRPDELAKIVKEII
jgi:pimeloyl-ACP methyl ester carboxylesterase